MKSPEYYFNSANAAVDEAADNLMMLTRDGSFAWNDNADRKIGWLHLIFCL